MTPILRFLRGHRTDPAAVRPLLLVLLSSTALLYGVGLGSSGWANSFYSAAVQAGAQSWKAFFFGSTDAANAITVDKAPGALWPMDLFARCFGVNAWSILLPQALAGVASVGLLYVTVRRWYGPAAGLIAGAVLALTPVATLMFRYNNPDALLVLVLVAATYCVTRAAERGSGWWLASAGLLVGYGFLVKMLQAFLVLPAFVLVYLFAAPIRPVRKLGQLTVAGLVLLISAGWWILAVALVPAADRPYIGGSQHNSALELAFGYNGLGRISGAETGGLGNTNWDVGWARLLGTQMGTQIGWLLPAAVLALGAGLWMTRRAPLGDRTRAGFVLWGGWLVVTGAVFSFAQGIVHPYYSVALAPAVGALCGMGAVLVWRRRAVPAARVVLAGTVAIGAVLAGVLLARTDWQPWLRVVVPMLGLTAAVLLLVVHRLPRALARTVLVGALVASCVAPGAYSVATVTAEHRGAMPSAGPAGSGMPGGGHGPGHRRKGGGPARHGGGPFGTVEPGKELASRLRANTDAYTWVAATIGSDNAAGYQLASGAPVLAIGGYNGTDPAPTLARFQENVRSHKIHYFIESRLMGMHGGAERTGSDESQRIESWVKQHFAATTVEGTTIYDLTE
ncbi:glycosyltransferase family 39 protein [Sciscionella marina]|uniref:glycosyltransferase family 39 protein n=1 Tax=Sciscionella marina TaxID=508770 RepID=UPI00035C562F|nr:glycosyltransferase family 39 protein [Sciscionella marina]